MGWCIRLYSAGRNEIWLRGRGSNSNVISIFINESSINASTLVNLMSLEYKHSCVIKSEVPLPCCLLLITPTWLFIPRYWSSSQEYSSLGNTWWRHQMETFSALLTICAGNSPASGEFPTQRPVTLSFDVFFDLCLNKRLKKQTWGWWFETLSRPLWRNYNENG